MTILAGPVLCILVRECAMFHRFQCDVSGAKGLLLLVLYNRIAAVCNVRESVRNYHAREPASTGVACIDPPFVARQ
jgi:hypothetical protein